MQLLLLGTVHRDPAGKDRLLERLEQIRPTAISLEVSPASVRLRHKLGRRWRHLFKQGISRLSRELGLNRKELMALANLRGVFEYLRLPYEYRAAMAYAQRNHCPLFLLDDSKLASVYLHRLEEEILSAHNLTLLAKDRQAGGLSEEVKAEYAEAHKYVFRNRPWPRSWIKEKKALSDREIELSQKLRLLHMGLTRRAAQSLSGQEFAAGLVIEPEAVGYVPDTVVLASEGVHLYIGGWEHLVDDEEKTTLFSRVKDLAPGRKLCFDQGPEMEG